ncbi:hypothetical protein [Ramlibacter sp. 2FC]|uniref:hypothetical protein n=1 Tax=Ramlibacter sp. 2FC TaxID=2502188 RepID=UPI00201DD41D|nr:hypothetical protein [Ramlibacter sp. 2FC]
MLNAHQDWLAGLIRHARARMVIELMGKDLDYVMQIAGSPASVPTIAATRQVFHAAQQQGLGAQHMTAVLRLYEPQDRLRPLTFRREHA